MKEKLKYEMPEDNLSNYAAEAILTPFANKNSTSRLYMFKSALGHTVIPAVDPDRPLVDSYYSKNLVISTDDYKTTGKTKLLHTVEKVVNNMVTERAFIYYDYDKDEVDLEIVPLYQKCDKFGVKLDSEFIGKEDGYESEDGIYTKHFSCTDTYDGGMAYGKNINFIYDAAMEVIEDGIYISRDLSKRCSVEFMDTVEIFFNSDNNILKDLYGYIDENGNSVYRPFPLPGEIVTKDAVIAVSSVGGSFLVTSNNPDDSDNTKYLHRGSKVVDIEVYSDEVLENEFLEELRVIQKDYIRDIVIYLDNLNLDSRYKFSDTLNYKYMKLSGLIHNNLRVGSTTLNNKTYITIKTIDRRPLAVGDKITNRDGGKGTISGIFDFDVHAKDGTKIDAIINVTGLVNRENSAQLFEKELNYYLMALRNYLYTSKDLDEIKKANIIKWLTLADNKELADKINPISARELIPIFRDEFIRLKFDPYNHNFGFKEMYHLWEFTDTLYDCNPQEIIFNGKPLSEKHVYGKSFYLLQENGIYKGTSIRSDGIVNIVGALSKRGNSKKDHQTKWGTTATKISDLGLSIMLNYFTHSDKPLLKNDVGILTTYMQTLGVEFAVEKKGK